MAKNTVKQNAIDEIVGLLEKSVPTKEILRKLTVSYGKSESAIEKWLKEAKTVISKRKEHAETVRLEQTTQAIKDAAYEAIISDLEIEAILCTIATGNMRVEEIFSGEAVLRGITPTEQISAIDKLYKKRGLYAPTKLANTDTDGNNLPATINIRVIPTIAE